MDNLSVFIIVPAGVSFIIPILSHRLRWFPDVAGSVTTFIMLVLSLMTLNYDTIYKMGGWSAPYGIVFSIDRLSSMMLIITNFIAFLCALFSVDYIEKFYTSKLRYYSLFLLVVTGMNGVMLTSDLFSLFVFS